MRHAFGNTRMKFVAGAVLLCLGSVAAHAATIVGGGATLPAQGYGGLGTASRLMTPSAGSFLRAFTAAHGNPTISYCQTGSGAGKNVLAITGGNSVSIACVAPVPSTAPVGFSGTGLTQPHFVGSDSPLSAGDWNNYVAGHSASGAQPMQIPAVSGAISIAFNQPQIASLHLNETQVCQIFSGVIKTWQDPNLSSAITPVSGQTPTGNISVVFRQDGSGTSFSFSNHLTAKCGTASVVDPTGSKGFLPNGVAPLFLTNQDFATAAAAYTGFYFAKVPASGNPGVVDAISNTDSSIGYVEAANSRTGGLQVATVKNDADSSAIDPQTYGAVKLPVAVTSDMVIDSALAAGGRASLIALPSAPALAGCVKVVDPAAYATPATGYPIVAVSYLLANRTGNGTQLANVQALMAAPYDSAIQTATTFIGGVNDGLSWVTPTPAITNQSTCVIN